MIPTANAGTFEYTSRAEAKEIVRKIRAAQFLNRATFGARPADINQLATRMGQIGELRAAREWIDNQFEAPQSSHVQVQLEMNSLEGLSPNQTGINLGRYRNQAWWNIAISGDDQLRQRMAWALAQIFVVNDQISSANSEINDSSGNPRWIGLGNYYDMLVENAFGNYRDCLEDVTYSPIMGRFLSSLRNRKANVALNRFPDENYAREIQQLFSIGLYELHPNGEYKKDAQGELIPTYDNETIKSFARVFTGLNYARTTNATGGALNYNEPMIMYDSEHDTDEKLLLNGATLPAGQTGVQDITAALDNIADHPNVGPFISRILIQRFVKSNPSKRYLQRVTRKWNNNGSGQRGDFKAVIKAVLLDREAWRSVQTRRVSNSIVVRTRGSEHARLKEPVLRYTHFVRVFNPTVSQYPDGMIALPNLQTTWSQAAYKAPSVFNFYTPFYQPDGPITSYTASRRVPNGVLYAPEFALMDGVTANRTANRFRADIIDENVVFTLLNNSNGTVRCELDFNFSAQKQIVTDGFDFPTGVDDLMENLDMILCDGTMSDATRSLIATAITNNTTSSVDLATRGAILATLTSPDYLINE